MGTVVSLVTRLIAAALTQDQSRMMPLVGIEPNNTDDSIGKTYLDEPTVTLVSDYFVHYV